MLLVLPLFWAGRACADESLIADEYVKVENKIIEATRARELTQDQFRTIITSGEPVAEVPSEVVNEIRSNLRNLQNLSRTLGDDSFDHEQLISRAFSDSSKTPPGHDPDKKEGKEEESKVEEEARKRAAQKAAEEREKLRGIENLLANPLLNSDQDRGQEKGRRGGKNSEGDSGSSSPPPFNFPPPNNSNDDNQNNPGNGFDRLANRLSNLGNQGLSNFSQTSNRREKEEDKKSNFSLPPSKGGANSDSTIDSKPKPSLKLPPVQSGNLNLSNDKSQEFGMQGTPLSPMPFSGSNSPSIGSLNGPSGNSSGLGAQAGNSGMLGGQLSPNQAGMGSLNQDFPFSVTGETYDEESEYDGFPRYRVYDIPMTGSSGGGDAGDFSSSSASGAGSPNFRKTGVPQFLYFATPDELTLKEVPGIFRSLAAGPKKSRIQLLCSLKSKKKIGVCEKVRSDLDG